MHLYVIESLETSRNLYRHKLQAFINDSYMNGRLTADSISVIVEKQFNLPHTCTTFNLFFRITQYLFCSLLSIIFHYSLLPHKHKFSLRDQQSSFYLYVLELLSNADKCCMQTGTAPADSQRGRFDLGKIGCDKNEAISPIIFRLLCVKLTENE